VELIESLRHILTSLNTSKCIEYADSLIPSIQELWEELKITYKQYKLVVEKYERTQALKKQTKEAKETCKGIYDKLKILIGKVKSLTEKTKVSKLRACDIVTLASQFPLTKHSYVTDEQIQVSALRIMPYNKQTRMPPPIVEVDAEPKNLMNAEIFIRMPPTLPKMYERHGYIMYTLDGSIPTSVNGIRYNPNDRPKIKENTFLKAVSCHLGRFDSEIVKRTYIVDENSTDAWKLQIEEEKKRNRGAVRPSGPQFMESIRMSDTPLGDNISRPSSSNPLAYVGSFHMPTPGRNESLYQASNPEDVL